MRALAGSLGPSPSLPAQARLQHGAPGLCWAHKVTDSHTSAVLSLNLNFRLMLKKEEEKNLAWKTNLSLRNDFLANKTLGAQDSFLSTFKFQHKQGNTEYSRNMDSFGAPPETPATAEPQIWVSRGPRSSTGIVSLWLLRKQTWAKPPASAGESRAWHALRGREQGPGGASWHVALLAKPTGSFRTREQERSGESSG